MWKRITHSLSANIAFGILATICVLGAVSLASQAIQISRDSATAATRLNELTAKKKEFETALREAEMEDTIRYKAKARFNLKNPGENIVVVLSDKKEASSTPGNGASWWEQITSFVNRIVGR